MQAVAKDMKSFREGTEKVVGDHAQVMVEIENRDSDAWNRNTLSMLPKVSHHASGREAALCVQYQAEGQCRANCPFAHVPPSQLTKSQQKQAQLACKKAYG
jgi:hypothetical protein